VAAYESGGPFRKEKRINLVVMAMKGEDDECLRIMANVFEKVRNGFNSHMYWKDLDVTWKELRRRKDRDSGCQIL
jgi:streptomycin 6-kinase